MAQVPVISMHCTDKFGKAQITDEVILSQGNARLYAFYNSKGVQRYDSSYASEVNVATKIVNGDRGAPDCYFTTRDIVKTNNNDHKK